MSDDSSEAPVKPSECPTDVWNSLHDIIAETEALDENDQNYNNYVIPIEIPNMQDKENLSEQANREKLSFASNNANGTDILLEIIDVDVERRPIEREGEVIIQNPNEHENSEVTKSRKRKRNEKMWKQNVRKRGRQSGKEYVDVTRKTKPGKCVKSISCNEKNCLFRCYSKITEDERKIIFDKFWKLTDDKKSNFYSKHVVRQPAVRKRTKSEVSKKTFSYVYHLYVRGVKIKVCQEFFLATLNISKNRIYYFFKKVQDPKSGVPRSPLTGKHKKKVILDERKELVRKHIASFPTVDSHYCQNFQNIGKQSNKK